VLCLEFIVVRVTVHIGQCYCVIFGVYCGNSNSRYRAMLLCFLVEFIVVRSTVNIVELNCIVCGVYCG